MRPACARPLSDEDLLAWWAGELSAPDAEALETHLLGCEECGRGRGLYGVAHGVRELLRRGELPAALAPAVVERLEAEGVRIREYRVPPGGSVQCTVSPDDDVVLARLASDLEGVPRLDVAIRVDDGPEQRLTDLPFDAAAGELIFAASTSELRSMPAHVQRMRLLAVDAEGERLLGEYTFHHRPWSG